jgi:hypothetical protein
LCSNVLNLQQCSCGLAHKPCIIGATVVSMRNTFYIVGKLCQDNKDFSQRRSNRTS